MNDEPSPLAPIAVRPLYEDLPPFAYGITDENLAEVGAHLGLNAVVRNGTAVLEIPYEFRFGLTSEAGPGDWIIRHPMSVRHLEVVPDSKMWRVYARRGATADLDDLVHAEVPTATAWAIIADTPDGVAVFPGKGIHGTSHLVGIAQVVATRFAHRGATS